MLLLESSASSLFLLTSPSFKALSLSLLPSLNYHRNLWTSLPFLLLFSLNPYCSQPLQSCWNIGLTTAWNPWVFVLSRIEPEPPISGFSVMSSPDFLISYLLLTLSSMVILNCLFHVPTLISHAVECFLAFANAIPSVIRLSSPPSFPRFCLCSTCTDSAWAQKHGPQDGESSIPSLAVTVFCSFHISLKWLCMFPSSPRL